MRDQNYTCYSIYLYIQNRKENPIKRILDNMIIRQKFEKIDYFEMYVLSFIPILCKKKFT